MKKESFEERHPALHSTVTVISTLSTCMLIGMAIESVVVGENYLIGALYGLAVGFFLILVLLFSIIATTD